ncbi:MAG: hypothetical protein M0R66_02080 [Candidatus Omnitrophica bacterium]|jgi:hypothetical protein|nr:hypothetical protein [Candidatus Omnitrophota bacterium]
MARNPQDINPGDVFPQRNLPGDAEKWGRTLEDRVIALEKAVLADRSSILGTNRNIAATTANIEARFQALTSNVFPVTFEAEGDGAPGFDRRVGFASVRVPTPEGNYRGYVVTATAIGSCDLAFTGTFPRLGCLLEAVYTYDGEETYGSSVTATGGRGSVFASRTEISPDWFLYPLIPGETVWVSADVWVTGNLSAVASNKSVRLTGTVLFYK